MGARQRADCRSAGDAFTRNRQQAAGEVRGMLDRFLSARNPSDQYLRVYAERAGRRRENARAIAARLERDAARGVPEAARQTGSRSCPAISASLRCGANISISRYA